MFVIFIFIIAFIFICYFMCVVIFTNNYTLYLFNSVLKNKKFRNIKKSCIDSSITLYQADNNGENFIFALKNDATQFSLRDIELLYEKSVKFHIHNKIIISSTPIYNSSPIYKKIREYEIDIWDDNKLIALSRSTFNNQIHLSSVLKTSDTSDDTCEIDSYQNNPIQDGKFKTHSLLSLFGDKPERL